MPSNFSADRTPLPQNLIAVTGVLLCPYLWFVRQFDWLCDDAFISFRYTKNLVAGHGLRFNVAETPPVEGFSNLLWVLALAPGEALGFPIPSVAAFLSVLCGVCLVLQLCRELAIRQAVPLLVVAGSVASYVILPSIAIWSTSGLETMAFAALVFGAFQTFGYGQHRGLAVLVTVALVLIRAEGFLWVGLLMATVALESRLTRRIRFGELWRALQWPLVAAVVTTLSLLTFRFLYFGYPLPNTVYAKAGMSLLSIQRGANYVASFLLAFPHLAVILGAGVLVAFLDRQSRRRLRQPLLITAAFLAYAVAVGGDFMPMGRFLIPAIPFIVLIFAHLLTRLAERSRAFAFSLVAVSLVSALLPAFDRHLVPLEVRERLSFRWNVPGFDSEYRQWVRMKKRVALGEELGRALAAHTESGESLIYGRIGAVGYFSDLFILDQNGLVDVEVARLEVQRIRSPGHDKTVPPSFFLDRKPDYFRAKLVEGEENLEQKAERLMFDLPAAERESYAAEIVPLKSSEDKTKALLLIRRSAS